MTGYRTDPPKPTTVGDDKWESWLAALDRVLSPAGPWSSSGDQPPAEVRLAVCDLRHDPYAARTARRFTTTTLDAWGLTLLLDDVELVMGELVINALRHGLPEQGATMPPRQPVRIVLALTRDSLLCVVTDPSEDRPAPREVDFAAEGGRGLRVVEGLSHRWGWAPLRSPGKAVWAGFHIPQVVEQAPRYAERSAVGRTPDRFSMQTGVTSYR
ncbi:ATP-binding protein [Sphaerisporangium aureirubrum]|uniref:ATP-binding protein n=1 Tax=Sphaerisporangium aureirubrum TaxID=1544736 RepID=A0ABW1NRJ1_9ACTN